MPAMQRRSCRKGGALAAPVVLLALLFAVSLPQGRAWQPGSPQSPKDPAAETAAARTAVRWSDPLRAAAGKTVLGKQDVYSCSVLSPQAAVSGAGSVTQVALELTPDAPSHGARLRQALLLDCDAKLWQLSGIQASEAACIAGTSALRAACNQWLVTIPTGGQLQSQSLTPPNTAFATTDSLQGRVLVLQTHWQLPESAVDQAVTLPGIAVSLGSKAAADSNASSSSSSSSSSSPALLGTFVGSGIYPPSSVSGSLQAFQLPAAAGSGDGSSSTADAVLACSKRCTYVPLGKLNPRPVTVVGYSFGTFDRAVSVSLDIQRGKWAKWHSSGQAVRVVSTPGQGVVQLQQPFQLHAGDTVRWRCSYNMSGIQPGSALQGGFSSSPDAQQEQCTVMLQYWPRVDAMRGCSAALDSDVLLGENMCSSEAEDLMKLQGQEARQFPMRRVYQEHSFPRGAWMGAWKATHLIVLMAAVWCCLWGFQTLLSSCKALGPIHRRFIALHAGQQRNVSLYLTHLVLDTLALAYVFQPMIELWLGLTETVAEVAPGMWGFSYIVACYALELTWRRSIDTMLAIHHIGTITIILLYAGELTSCTYRVANNIIVLAAFALMEQPTYVALLLKRMLPSHSVHVVRAARVGYISWFLLKGASVLLAGSMLREDWHLMPTWVKVNFVITWIVAILVQGWSGVIQRGICRHIERAHKHSKWDCRQEQLKRRAALALHAHGCATSSDEDTDGTASPPSCEQSAGGALSTPLLRRGRRTTGGGEYITAGVAQPGSDAGRSSSASQEFGPISTTSSDAAAHFADNSPHTGPRTSSSGTLSPVHDSIPGPLLQPRDTCL